MPLLSLPRQLSFSLSLPLPPLWNPIDWHPELWPVLLWQPSHHQASSDEASHEPDLQAEMVIIGSGGLPIRHQQEDIGHDADQGEGDEGEPHEAGTLSRAHREAFGKDGQ